ncbi:MAG TPA: isoprenylcysteine carboxylmethyltransferase family protein [Deltaproteobacteria bacterium]|nr:isoprenylcysteine carboxylmethyltransferase family protein [Deltaproteobacteria bacterium]HPP81661.1 isoprenylcysteine carboxylmethyltransferase family protein [Deltaproteobacteria bacterium]
MASFSLLLSRKRIAVSRVAIGALALCYLVSEPMWRPQPVFDAVMDMGAFLLVLAGAFGRLWALAYIGSRKNTTLVTTGPYSITRNPLYLFSLLGALGIGFMTDSLVVLAAVAVMFAAYYPFVIRSEQRLLESLHGRSFTSYMREVPAFLPKFSLFKEPEEITVNTRYLRRSFFSVMWFPII